MYISKRIQVFETQILVQERKFTPQNLVVNINFRIIKSFKQIHENNYIFELCVLINHINICKFGFFSIYPIEK